MKVEIYFDTICSWCRLEKVLFKSAIEKAGINKDDLEIVYRSYVMYPDIPAEGLNLEETRKSYADQMDLETLKPLDSTLHRWAGRVGMKFNFDKITSKPNAIPAHQILRMVPPDKFEDVLSAFHKAYFEDGVDMRSLDTMLEIASKFVDNTEEIKKRVLAGEFVEQILADTAHADKYDFNFVPLFVFDGKVTVDGPTLEAKFVQALKGQLEPNV